MGMTWYEWIASGIYGAVYAVVAIPAYYRMYIQPNLP